VRGKSPRWYQSAAHPSQLARRMGHPHQVIAQKTGANLGHRARKRECEQAPALPKIEPYLYCTVNEAMCVRQISLLPSRPIYSLADQKVNPSDGSTTVEL